MNISANNRFPTRQFSVVIAYTLGHISCCHIPIWRFERFEHNPYDVCPCRRMCRCWFLSRKIFNRIEFEKKYLHNDGCFAIGISGRLRGPELRTLLPEGESLRWTHVLLHGSVFIIVLWSIDRWLSPFVFRNRTSLTYCWHVYVARFDSFASTMRMFSCFLQCATCANIQKRASDFGTLQISSLRSS